MAKQNKDNNLKVMDEYTIDYSVFEDQCYMYDSSEINLRRQLYYACKHGHAKMAKLLIKTQSAYGTKEDVKNLVNSKSKQGRSLLKIAITSGSKSGNNSDSEKSEEVAKVLIGAGATFDGCKYTIDEDTKIPTFENDDIDLFYQSYICDLEDTIHYSLDEVIPVTDIIDTIVHMAILPSTN